MRLIVNHFKQFGNIRVIKLCPNFNFVLYLVEVVHHLHLPFKIISNRPLRFQAWFVHYFHSEFSQFNVIILLTNTSAYNSFDFRKCTTSNIIANLKLINKLLIVNSLNLHFVSIVHAGALFKELLVSYRHIDLSFHNSLYILWPIRTLLH